jgi:cell wall-associated NlpC family hydrolase
VFGAVEGFFVGFWKRIKQGFTDVVEGIKSAWGGVSSAVQKPLQAMDNNVYAPFAHIVNAGLGIFGVSAKLPAHLMAQKKAGGGAISGAGTGLSDQIPIMASNGEYVLKAAAVRKVGKRNLDNLNGNSGRSANTERYATGGQVVNDATKWKGHQYVWGGPANPTNGWDCSSFMSYVLGKDQVPLPDGFHVGQNGSPSHGPVASAFRSSQPKDVSKTSPGDVAVEKNGNHVGMVISQGQKNQVQGFAAKGKAYGTVPQVFGKDAYDFYQVPGVNNEGVAGQALNWMKQGLGWLTGSSEISTLTDAASAALSGITGLLGKVGSGGKTIPPQLGAGVAKKFLNAGTSKINNNPLNWLSGASSVGESDVGNAVAGAANQGSEDANGRAIYNYLLKNLFSGNKIAAAGATASIWGESSWNPMSQGTGGRGLIGWTPPSKISDATFKSGLSGQLPAIIDFVNQNGDAGVINQMMKATSVLEAANEWGKGVERFGVNDVHSQGVALATGFMGGKYGGGTIHTPGPGVPKADQWNVNVADGEKVLTRSQAQNYQQKSGPSTEDLLQMVVNHLAGINQSSKQTAQATQSTAQSTGGLNKVKRSF